MRAIESGGVRATLADDGILRLWMMPGCRPGPEDASRIADAVEEWTGLTSPMRTLVDCEGATGLYLGWRVEWTKRIKRNLRPVRLAYYNRRSMAAWIMPYFAMVTGIEARGFTTQADAEAWLRSHAPLPPATYYAATR